MIKRAEEPVSRAFVPAKQGAQRHYGVHPYFTKRAWNVVQEYIRHYTSPGDVVLDPFGGSGVTAVEALVLRRRAVYADINPWACFLARLAALAPVDLGRLHAGFGAVEKNCRNFIEALWETPNGRLETRPVADWYPKGIRLPGNADVDFVEELFTPRMLHGLARLRAAIAALEDEHARDLLLFAFSATLARINRTFLSSTNRAESRGGSAIFSLYRYKVARNAVEMPLWPQFTQRFRKLLAAKRETNQVIGGFYQEGKTAVFRHGSATRLSDWLKPGSVDYIYTDPPYGGHIAYLDLSTMWTAWLQMSPTEDDRREEIIEGGQARKTSEDYSELMERALAQMHAALKRSGWLSLVYAHRDASYWERLVDACRSAGFAYCNTVVQPVGVVWSMHKKKNPLRVLSGELVLNFRKPAARGRIAPPPRRDGRDAVAVARDLCEREITSRFGASTEELHHAVIPGLLETGRLADFARSHGDLTRVLEEFFAFDRRSGKWHLREDADPLTVSDRGLLRYLAGRFLASRANRSATLPEVKTSLEPKLPPDASAATQITKEVLTEIAVPGDRERWSLPSDSPQGELDLKI